MNKDEKWQKSLEDFLAENPPSPDIQVLARTYDTGNDTDVEAALNIEQHLDDIGLQEVPESLQQKLQAIGVDESEIEPEIGNSSTKRNVVAFPAKKTWFTFGGIAATVALFMFLTPDNPDISPPEVNQYEMTAAEVEQAREDLRVALTYVAKFSQQSTDHLNQTINSNLQRPVVSGVAEQLNKLRDS